MIDEINKNNDNVEYWKKEYLEISKENEELLKYKNAWNELMVFLASVNVDKYIDDKIYEIYKKHNIGSDK